MNYELLEYAPAVVRDHVIREFDRERMVSGACERGLELAIRAWRDGKGIAELPGTPPAADAPAHEWVAYFVGQGSLVYHDTLFEGSG